MANNFDEAFKPFLDKNYLITMANGDHGDSPMKSAFFYLGEYMLYRDSFNQAALRSCYDKALTSIQKPDGNYFRDPTQYPSVTDPWRNTLSRDQEFPTIVATGVMGLEGRFNQLLKNLVKRFSTAENGDFFGPGVWACFFGIKGWWWLWPLMVLFDLELLANTFIRLYKTDADADDVGDDMNHCLGLMARRWYLSTPVSWLARVLYVRFRMPCYGCYIRSAPDAQASDDEAKDSLISKAALYCHPVIGSWRWYYRTSQGAPPSQLIWEPLLTKYLLE